jgi:hypothetical protein
MANIKTSRTIREFRYHDVSGKGGAGRPRQVQEQQVSDNWCATFGHRMKRRVCQTCGKRK